MPGYGYGSFGTISSSDTVAGRQYTRLRGPVLLGNQGSSLIGDQSGANMSPAHLVNVSTASVNFINAMTSFATGVATSSSQNVSTGAPTGIVYITQSTGAGNMVHAASTANAPVGLPGGATGVGVVWDAAYKTIAIYDPGSSAWLVPHWAGSSGSVITWSATSS